jgi:hypothetical protein
MKASAELVDFVTDLQNEAAAICKTRFQGDYGERYVDAGKLNALVAGCRLLVAKLGSFGHVWDEMLNPPIDNKEVHFNQISGVLDAIANALGKGRLSTIEELVSSEVLGDLLEHAEELLKSKFNFAAAIVLRAVLEERLRKLCNTHNCKPTVQRPTVESFKQSLFSAKVIDKIVVKDIDWMAGVGNAAAHHLPEYKDEDVPQFYQRLTAFLTRFSAT